MLTKTKRGGERQDEEEGEPTRGGGGQPCFEGGGSVS